MGKSKKLLNSEIEINLGEANPKQAKFYASRALYTAYGGARGGGKSHAVRVKAIIGALSWPGIKILIVRRTYPDLENSIISPMLAMLPKEVYSYSSTAHRMSFINGSTVWFGNFQGYSSESHYRGSEFDWIFIDEATQFTEEEFRVLGGCLRGVNAIPKRFYLTCNPGGIGHFWVKRLFIDRDYLDSENDEEREDPRDYNFIFATVEDNLYLLESSPAYMKMLAQMPAHLRRAHRYGDWDALSGRYFSEFSEKTHVIDPVPIPRRAKLYRTLDYGLDMLACYWLAACPNGRIYCYRELRLSGKIVSEAAKAILEHTRPDEEIVTTFAPPDIYSTQKDTGKTMAEIFSLCGVPLTKAPNSRISGNLCLRELLVNQVDGEPVLQFFKSCRDIIRDLKSIQASETNPSDCATEPHYLTHGPDALRYFAASRILLPEPPEVQVFTDELAAYDTHMTGHEASHSYMSF